MRPRGLIVAAVAALMVVAFSPPPSVQALTSGYWDINVTLKGKGREPVLVNYNGTLYNFYSYRTELKDIGIDQAGRRSDIYYNVFNGTNWSMPVTIVPNNKDTNGHGIHAPRAVEYRGKLYVTSEAVEPSIKDDDAQSDYDILLRVFDGTGWTPPVDMPAQVISERNDANASDIECRGIVYRDTLYFIWSQIPAVGNGTNQSGVEHRRVVYRTFDGNSWGPITVAADDGVSYFDMSTLAVFKDRLWVCFQSNTSTSVDMDIMACSFDGTSWSALHKVNPIVPGFSVKRQNLNACLKPYGDRLYCTWESADTIAKSSPNYDIMLSSTDGTSWTYAQQVNRPNDEGQDTFPFLEVNAGLLYLAWSSDDPQTTDGQRSADIVMRSFDGANWSTVSNISPWGDNGTISGDHNPGDDNTPWLLSFEDRLYCTWVTYDQVGTGHKGGNPSVIVRQVVPPYSNGSGGGTEPPEVEHDNGGTAGVSWTPVMAAGALFVVVVLASALLGMRKAGRQAQARHVQDPAGHDGPERKGGEKGGSDSKG